MLEGTGREEGSVAGALTPQEQALFIQGIPHTKEDHGVDAYKDAEAALDVGAHSAGTRVTTSAFSDLHDNAGQLHILRPILFH